jgi:hypothetical protein
MSAVAETRWSPVPLHAVQGSLALDLGAPPAPAPRPATRETSVLRGADAVVVPAAVRRELHQWALTFGQACVEVVLGDRPVTQLVRWTTPPIHRELAYRARVVSQATLRQAGGHGARRPAVRPQVRQVRACFVTAGVAEVAFTVQHGARHRAIAARLEVIGGRWQCTALEFG